MYLHNVMSMLQSFILIIDHSNAGDQKKKHIDFILLNINLTVSQHIKALLQTFSNGYDHE